MNKEKLIDIILKDIEELKDISEEIKETGANTTLETDIALSKANLILQEFQLLKKKYSEEVPTQVSAPVEKETVIAATEETVIGKTEEEIEKPIATFQEEEKEPDDEPVDKPDEITEEPDDYEENDTEDEDFGEDNYEDEVENDMETEEDKDLEEDNYTPDNTEEEEEEEENSTPQTEKKTVGENFHIERSLNDMMGNNNTLDQKIAHSPIASLQSAIGINDRFLFIREVFNNDTTLYSEAIKQIDRCENIRQAVDYLSSNFKIKKTEASLKFVELIRRRFTK